MLGLGSNKGTPLDGTESGMAPPKEGSFKFNIDGERGENPDQRVLRSGKRFQGNVDFIF